MTRRAATRQQCNTCQADVLTGLDSDVAGIPVTVDPTPLDALGEAVAVLTGRRTYTMRRARGDRGEQLGGHLTERTASSIRSTSGLTVNVTVGEHRCGQPLPESTRPAVSAWATGTEF